MGESKVFYSWQSDLPNSTNRGFIQKALDNAAKAIHADASIKVEPVIDRDTAGVPGSPDIAKTIFDKIEKSQVFVCDVSIINKRSKFRNSPNPNVLIELGYAIKTLGEPRILMVINTAFGVPELLPFDLNKKRVLPYDMPEQCENRATERKVLESKLEAALRAILTQIETQRLEENTQTLPIGEQARAAVENAQPNQVLLVRKFMDWLVSEINTLKPDFSKNDERDDLLVDSIKKTRKLVIDFAQLGQSIAMMNASETALALYRTFDTILKHYYVPRVFSGIIPTNDFDFYKFIGHELFVTFVSFLIRENRWELISDILDEEIYIENREQDQAGLVSFGYISKHVGLLDYRNKRLKFNRISVHADILKERHTEGDLAVLVTMQQLMDADYFLFLRTILGKEKPKWRYLWKPWSTIFMQSNPPRFLLQATRKSHAEKLLHPLGVQDVETLKARLIERGPMIAEVFGGRFYCDLNPLEYFDVNDIAVR